jgi:hypothetical protein
MSPSAGSGLRKSSASRNAVHLTTFSHYSVFGRIPSACLTNQLRMRLSDWEERSVEAMQCASSAAWASSPQGSRTISEFDGRDVVLVITPSATGGHALSSVIWLETRDRLVVRQRWYFRCSEFLRYAAEHFRIEMETHGYHSPK